MKKEKRGGEGSENRKVAIVLPGEVYAIYEQIAADENITVSQVIARVAIEFVDIENEASRARRQVLGSYREELLGKFRPASRKATKRE